MFQSTSSPRSGFTLVEVLVVVLIVSLIAVIIVVRIQDGKKAARDAQRLTDLQNLQLALRLYKDAYGVYPRAGCSPSNPGEWKGIHPDYGSCADYIEGLSEFYGGPLPLDPTSNARFGYIYRTDASRANYKLMAYVSVEATFVGGNHQFGRFRDCTGHVNSTTFAVWDGPASFCW